MATITRATKSKWIREAATYLPAVRAARSAALALRRESLGQTYVTPSGHVRPLNYLRRIDLAGAYCAARESYYHSLNRWRAFEVRP
jgi:hypothetical protein